MRRGDIVPQNMQHIRELSYVEGIWNILKMYLNTLP